MMLQQESSVPQELSALMALQQGMERGQVMPTTPQGTPTVAAQMAGAAQQQMSPAVGEIAQQAGLAAQIQAMRQQQMQQALMQQASQAMQQQGMAAGGVAGLNANIRGFNQGGIVGYNGEEDSAVIDPQFGGSGEVDRGEPRLRVPGPKGDRMMTPAEMRAERYPEEYIQRRLETEGFISKPTAAKPSAEAAPAPPPPPAPPAPPAASRPSGPSAPRAPSQMDLANKAIADLETLGKYKQGTATPQEGVTGGIAQIEAKREFARRLGLDPDIFMTQAKQAEDYYKRREEALGKRKAELEARSPSETRIRTLLGMRGRGFGETVSAGATAGMNYEQSVRQQIANFEDLQMQMEGLRIDKVNALKQLKYSTDMGEYDKAMIAAQKIKDIEAAQNKTQIEIGKSKLTSLVNLAQIEEAGKNRGIAAEANRLGAIQTRLNAAQGQFTAAKDKWEKQTAEKYPILKIAFQPGGDKLLQNPDMRAQYEQAAAKAQEDYIRAVAPAEATLKRLQQEVLGGQSIQATPEQRAAFAKYGVK